MSAIEGGAAAQLINLGIILAEGAARALPDAIVAVALIRQMITTGRDPTAAEWAQLDAAADALHAQLQGI